MYCHNAAFFPSIFPPLPRSISHPLTFSLFLSLSLSHTHIHKLSPSLSLSLSLSLSHTHTRLTHFLTLSLWAQSAGAREYTDCTSAERYDSPNECPGYNTKQSDGQALVMLEFGGMSSTSLLPSLPCPLEHGVVALDRVISIGQIELNSVLMLK